MRFSECVTLIKSSSAHEAKVIGVFPAITIYMRESA
jgi:hypothetical protein